MSMMTGTNHPYELRLKPRGGGPYRIEIELKRRNDGNVVSGSHSVKSSAGSELDVSVNVASLAPGDYEGILRVKGKGAKQECPIAFHRLAEPVAEQVPFGIYAVPLPVDDMEKCRERLREVKNCGINLIIQHTINLESYGREIPALDEAARLGIRIMPSINLYLKNADVDEKDRTCFAHPDEPIVFGKSDRRQVCFTSPVIRQIAVDRLKRELKVLRKNPAVDRRMYYGDDFFILPGFKEKRVDLACYCERCRSAFKKATGLEPPVTTEAVRGVVPDDHPWLLWNRFRCAEVFGGLLRRLDEARSEVAPDVVMGMVHGFPFAPFTYARCGIYSPVSMPLPAISSYAYPYLRSPRQDFIAHYECGRMGNRDKPVWMLGAINSNYTNYPAWQVYQNFWNMLAAGYDFIALFAWWDFVRAEEIGVTGNIAECKQALADCGRAKDWLFPIAAHWKPLPAPFASLYSFTTEVFDIAPEDRNHEHLESLLAFYRETLRKRVPMEVICEEEVNAGILDKYEAVCLPGVRALPDNVKTALEKYIEQGGTVLTDRDPLRYYNPLRAGPVVNGSLEVSSETAAAILRDRRPPSITVDNEHVTLRRMRSGALEYVVLVNNYADQYWGFEWCYGRERMHHNHEHMGYVQSLPVKAEVRFANDGCWLADLATGEILGSTDSPLHLTIEPSWGRALALLPCSSVHIEVAADGMVPLGGIAQVFSIKARSDGDLPVRGAFAVEMKLISPSGEVDGRGGFISLVDGSASCELRFGVNDEAGDWIMEFTGGFPRKTLTRKLTLTTGDAHPALLDVKPANRG